MAVAATPDRTVRRRIGRRGARLGSSTSPSATIPDLDPDALRLEVHHRGDGHATVEVSGLLVRQHAHLIDEALTRAFRVHRACFVIDLRGVTLLDSTTLSAIIRPAHEARRRGALITIVPPGTPERSAA
jgi:anti-anti-sigma factor